MPDWHQARRVSANHVGRAVRIQRDVICRSCIVDVRPVDHFKQINDRHGHDTCDRLLSAMAQRIDAGLREIVSR
ncbi:diguanylate cyclase [Pseudoxanthomonas sp. CAU 1598]|uniref:Diguanylate cyclase n=1 Tax=Pseudomarimonas arenosa TaxID=2774145 RepID=A0AAW3ZR85_9GAMM|nr:diguanylate cyclase [Pseudomarimonas arenosa]MBD8528050.1 diguanylate cyclase [Pseudomarimonas arenosa]